MFQYTLGALVSALTGGEIRSVMDRLYTLAVYPNEIYDINRRHFSTVNTAGIFYIVL